MSDPRPDASAIRAARPAKPVHYAWAPLGHRWDVERGMLVEERQVLTVFLAGAECPFTCLFCDLWQHTLRGRTPEGALPQQLATALEEGGRVPEAAAIKLYNASNFFDRRAVPPADLGHIAEACSVFARVTVESHPKLLGERCEAFARSLSGRLEVAMGLETVHPDVFPRLKDGMSISDFDAAIDWAGGHGIGVRAFVLVGLPWVPADEFAEWAARSAAHAAQAGAARVSLIPLRVDGGALARLARSGDLDDVSISHLESGLALSLEALRATECIVEADLWDAGRFADCQRCAEKRIGRLARMNASQRVEPAVECACSS